MAKTKALISCAVTAQLICTFVFAQADCWFSHIQNIAMLKKELHVDAKNVLKSIEMKFLYGIPVIQRITIY